jgi:hypothetical protein
MTKNKTNCTPNFIKLENKIELFAIKVSQDHMTEEPEKRLAVKNRLN